MTTKWQGLYYVKFVGFFLLLWVPGFILTYFTGSLSIYLGDWHYHFYAIMLTILLFLLVDLCQQTASALSRTNKIIPNFDEKEFVEYAKRANKSSILWYGFCVLAPLVFAISLESYNQFFSQNIIVSGRLAVVNLDCISSTVSALNFPYAIYSAIFLFLILGIGANRFIHYLITINRYGKRFLQNASIDLLTPGSTDGLKDFRRLVLKSSFFCSLALAMSSLFFFENLINTQTISYYWLCTMVIVVLFFVYTILSQMKWVNKSLSKSKKDALSVIDKKISQLRSNIHDINNFVVFTNLFEFRDKIKKTPTWTFDSDFLSRSFLAITVPILGGAVSQIILERIINPIIP
jgi:hypothetical protein